MTNLLFALLSLVFADTTGGPIAYKDGKTQLEGYLARPAGPGTYPAVLIVHDWMGLGDFAKEKANMLARDWFVAMAVDVYGKGVRPKDSTEASEFAGKYKGDRPMLRERMKAALKTLVSQKGVDPKRVVVMGYCFGGTAALELARSGAQLAGVVSFHGGLSTPTPQDAKNIKGKVLTLHGEDDPYVNKDEVAAFKKELTDANVSFEFISYPGAVHSFAVPSAGSDNSKGAAYNAEADKKSWERFKEFLNEVAKR